jgi:hypothetical protein
MKNFLSAKAKGVLLAGLLVLTGISEADASNISGRQLSCANGSCTFVIDWWVSGGGSVVTVKSPEADEEFLYACEGNVGSSSAPWIPDGGSLVFRVYEGSYCASDIRHYVPVAAERTLTGNSSYSRPDGFFCVCQGYEAQTMCSSYDRSGEQCYFSGTSWSCQVDNSSCAQ